MESFEIPYRIENRYGYGNGETKVVVDEGSITYHVLETNKDVDLCKCSFKGHSYYALIKDKKSQLFACSDLDTVRRGLYEWFRNS